MPTVPKTKGQPHLKDEGKRMKDAEENECLRFLQPSAFIPHPFDAAARIDLKNNWTTGKTTNEKLCTAGIPAGLLNPISTIAECQLEASGTKQQVSYNSCSIMSIDVLR